MILPGILNESDKKCHEYVLLVKIYIDFFFVFSLFCSFRLSHLCLDGNVSQHLLLVSLG